MTMSSKLREPQVFPVDDPRLERLDLETTAGVSEDPENIAGSSVRRPSANDIQRGIRWGTVLLAAMTALATLAAGLWFVRFIGVALERQDWIGWTAFSLLGIAAFAGIVLLLREIAGLLKLTRLGQLRKDIDAALREKDSTREREAVKRLKALFSPRPEMRWPLKRFAEHEHDVLGPGELLSLADRALVAPLDQEARRTVVKSAKRVSVVTAVSPMAWVAVSYVLIENMRMLRALAGLYGGRPGLIGGLRLARMVVAHIVATGGLALTDDLLGQFLGQDVLRRLSRRLGEGAFNGAMTARIGTAAIEVCRPLPFLDATPIRVRDLLPELFRRPAAKPGAN